jgi:anti-anti-sigma factor
VTPDLEVRSFRQSNRAPVQPLQITVQDDGPSLVLHVHGEIDLSTVETLRTCLEHELSGSSDSLVVDVAGVTFLDCAGINLLVRSNAQLTETGRTLSVRNPSATIRRVFTIVGIDNLLIDGTEAPDAAYDPQASPASDEQRRGIVTAARQ